MREPRFWYPGRDAGMGLLPGLLSPLSGLYHLIARTRLSFAHTEKAAVPIICVGNVTAGGAGKTPVAMSIASNLLLRGENVHFLSRGYGGREKGPLRVDAQVHSAQQVGDEPLLLSKVAPTWVSSDRGEGAAAAVRGGASVILMDDGLQNPSLAKDFSILVVDAAAGIGNGRLIPSGPLRETVADALAKVGVVVTIGRGHASDGLAARANARGIPVFKAVLRPVAPVELGNRRVVAFAGIGRPQKFFQTLRELRLDVVETISFPDHHSFTEKDARELLIRARELDAQLLTTEKDAVRLLHSPQGSARARLNESLLSVPVQLVVAEFPALQRLVAEAIAHARGKRGPVARA